MNPVALIAIAIVVPFLLNSMVKNARREEKLFSTDDFVIKQPKIAV